MQIIAYIYFYLYKFIFDILAFMFYGEVLFAFFYNLYIVFMYTNLFLFKVNYENT